MKVTPIKTRIVLPPQDDILDVLDSLVPKLKENMMVIVASKIVAIWEGRSVPLSDYPNKDELIIQEAEKYLPREFIPGGWVMPAIKNYSIIASAGIDESNSNGYYTLWPENPHQSSKKIWDYLRQKSGVKRLGVIITDSHTGPMRWGVLGLAIAFCGFKPLIDYRGQKDLFGREFKIETTNIPDALAGAGVFVMGEGAESTPIALIEDIPQPIEFIESDHDNKELWKEYVIEPEIDIYGPVILSAPWQKGGKG